MATLSNALIEAEGFPVSAEINSVQAVVIPLRTVPAQFLVIVQRERSARKATLLWKDVADRLYKEGFHPDHDSWDRLQDG